MAKSGAELDSRRRFELWSLREDVDVELGPAGDPARLRSPWGEFTVPRPSPLVREALHRMRLGPVSLGNILSRRRRAAKPAAGQADAVEGTETKQQQLYQVLERLQPLIIRSVKMETGRPLLSVVPLTPRSVFRPGALSPDLPVRLSTFAELRTDGHE